MIGSILKKLASGIKLTGDELLQLELWGERTEMNDSFITGLQNGSSSIHVEKIKAVFGEYRFSPTGYSSKIRTTTSTTVPTTTNTSITWGGVYYDELGAFTGSGTTINIKITGKYRFVLYGAMYSNPAATTGRIEARIVGGGVLSEQLFAPFSTNLFTSFQLVGEASIKNNTNISVEVLQSSGASMTCSASLTLSLVKPYDNEIFNS